MGMLVAGNWNTDTRLTTDGRYHRPPSPYRNWIDPNGPHPPAADRYHLYVSLACPWASRTVIARKLKGLEKLVGMTVVHPDMLENGWTFDLEEDAVHGWRYLYEVYRTSNPTYTGRVTVPVLWDRDREVIVNNESGDILRMFNSAFSRLGDDSLDLAPPALLPEIDTLNDRLYNMFNNAVYRAGFATDQNAYASAVHDVFTLLDELNTRLRTQPFLFGDTFTESDIRLFTSAIRFDVVYYNHFKCNLRHFWDYPHLQSWLRAVYHWAGVADTVDFAQIKRHYFGSQRWINPSGIVPLGPELQLEGSLAENSSCSS